MTHRPPASPARRIAADIRRVRTALLFVAPLLLALGLVAFWPLLRTILFSFTDASLSDPEDWRFIGLSNYLELIQDARWRHAVAATLIFTAASVAIETMLGLVIALALSAEMRGRGAARAAMLIPWAIPTVIAAKMWAWMLNDLNGVVNALLLGVGAIAEPLAWLADPVLSMIAIVAVDVWKATPFMALLTLAAMQSIPAEVYESARIDASGPVRTFFAITLPLIAPALLIAALFRMVDAMRVFDVIYALAGSASATASMSIYARQQLLDFQDVGFGSAAATCVFAVIALAAAILATVGRLDLRERGADA